MLKTFMNQEKKLFKCLIVILDKSLDVFMNHEKQRHLKYQLLNKCSCKNKNRQ